MPHGARAAMAHVNAHAQKKHKPMQRQQRWAEIEIAAIGGSQEAVGALLTFRLHCAGYATTDTTVTAYLPVDDRLEGTLHDLRDGLVRLHGDFPDVNSEITLRFVNEEDWANAWKEFFKPQRVGERIVIKPSWESWDAAPNDVVVQLDPGMAFGTGHHSTTRLCLRALEDLVTPGARVADVGTGSGILAVAATLLGASDVFATDIDPLAVQIARENVSLNGVADRVTVADSDAPPVDGTFDIVVANILADVILDLRDGLKAAVKPDGGLLVVSGIIEHRAEDVRRGLAEIGFAHIETREEGDWVAILLRA